MPERRVSSAIWLVCISMITRIFSQREKKAEQNLVDANTVMTSKATGLIFYPSWITFSSLRLLSAFSFHLQQHLLLFLFIIVFGLDHTEAGFIIHRTAQINISGSRTYNAGILIDASERISFEADCTNVKYDLLYPMWAHFRSEQTAVQEGFYAIDTCGSPTAAMHQALAFVPNSLVCCKSYQSYSDVLSSIPVYGVVSTLRPTHTSPAFAVLNAAGVPSISMFSLKKLSNRKRYPNLYNISPNEDIEVKIIPLLLKDNAWHYISVVHEASIVFSDTFHKLKAEMELVCKVNDSECLCIATVQTLTWDASNCTADTVVNELVEQKEVGANVVVVIASFQVVLKLFEAVNRHVSRAQFVWIATQSWVGRFLDLRFPSVCAQFANTLLILPFPPRDLDYYWNIFGSYLKKELPNDESWYRVTVQRYLCKDLDPEECNNTVWQWFEEFKVRVNPFLMILFQKAYTLVQNALFDSMRCLYNSKCFRERMERSLKKHVLFEIKLERQWTVFSIRGNNNAYVVGKYMYSNNSYTSVQPFTLMAAINESVILSPLPICEKDDWGDTFKEEPLFSGCRPDCKPQEKHVAQKPKECCWRCVKCRHYEIVTENRTSCEMCPETKWPDNTTNFTTCYSLPVVTSTFSDYWPKILVTMAVCLIALDLGVIAFFLWNREERVIKATSLQLSMLMQLGLIVGGAGIIVSCAPAGPLTCPLSAVLYDLSSSLRLCPLFVRTLLIFRIFRKKRRVTVSMRKWVMLCLLLAVVKPILSLMEWPCPKASQPHMYVPYVELHCDYIFTLESAKREIQRDMSQIVHYLKTAYTSLLTLLCLGLAYQLRHLPNNFNESGFIFVCICAEIISASLISSAAAVQKLHLPKMYFFSLGDALTLLLYLIFLFFTKIYAVLFVVRHQERPTGTTTSYIATSKKCHEKLAPVTNVNSGHFLTLDDATRDSARKLPAQSPSYIQKMADEDGSTGSRAGWSTREVIAEDSDRTQKSRDHEQDLVGSDPEAKLERGTPGESPETTTDALSTQGLEDKQLALRLLTNSDKVGAEDVLVSQNSADESTVDDEAASGMKDEGSDKLNLDTLSTLSSEVQMKLTDEVSEKLNLDTLSNLSNEVQMKFKDEGSDVDSVSTEEDDIEANSEILPLVIMHSGSDTLHGSII